MANEKNIIPHQFKPGDTSDKAANGRKGGIASGKSKRKKRELREIFEAIRKMPITIALPDKTTKEVDFDEAAVIAMYQKAMHGDVGAMKLIATMLGEYEQKVKMEGATPVLVTEEEMKSLAKWAKKDDEDPSI